MKKKRHHYVPKAYLNFFCDEEGKIRVYLKDDPEKAIHQRPDNTGFHKYYYSLPLPESGNDHNTLENIFSKLEAKWPPIVRQLQRRENVNDRLGSIFEFIALQRVRVPTNRDAYEKMLAEMVKATGRHLDEIGELLPKPDGLGDIWDKVQVTIDPYQSVRAMIHMLPIVGRLLDQVGICALHNATDIPFLTSDNPVIWFDPSVPDEEMQPYGIRPGGPIVLLFPVTPNLLIYGDTSMREQFTAHGLWYSELSEHQMVATMNRHICRFAYKAVFAQKPDQESLIREHAHESPVLQTDIAPTKDGELILHRHVFGKRKNKPKWAG